MARSFSLSVAPRQHDHTTVYVFTVNGSLDAHTFPDLEKEFHALMAQGQYRFVLDFKTLDYISSAGLGLLLGVQRVASRHSGDLKIANMPDTIYNIFDILGFSKLIGVYPSWEAAAQSFS
jgi:anti-sigma B factor antagonist